MYWLFYTCYVYIIEKVIPVYDISGNRPADIWNLERLILQIVELDVQVWAPANPNLSETSLQFNMQIIKLYLLNPSHLLIYNL